MQLHAAMYAAATGTGPRLCLQGSSDQAAVCRTSLVLIGLGGRTQAKEDNN